MNPTQTERVYPQLKEASYEVRQAVRQAFDYIYTLRDALRDRPIKSTVMMGGTDALMHFTDLHENRILIDPRTIPIGSTYFEKDRGVGYMVQFDPGEVNVWMYMTGVYMSVYANRPADLGVSDTGYKFYAVDTKVGYWWNGTVWVNLDAVLGAVNLTHIGTIPKVSAAGTLAESAAADDGADITIVGRGLTLDNGKYIRQADSSGNQRVVLYLDNANPDILHIRNNQRASGGTISFESKTGGGIGATLDNAGNLDLAGVLEIGGTQVVKAQEADPGITYSSPTVPTSPIAGSATGTYGANEQGLINTLITVMNNVLTGMGNLKTATDQVNADHGGTRTVLKNHGLMA